MLTGRFPTLRKLLIKMIEVAGAGCASAIAAFLLGNSREAERPPTPTSVPPAIVHLAPADEQMIRHVRDENAALAEQLRNSSDARSAAADTTPAAPASAPAVQQKPAKAASNAPARREQKTTRTAAAEAKQQRSAELQRAAEPQRTAESAPAQTATAPYSTDHAPAANVRAVESGDVRVIAAPPAPTESSPVPAQVPSRLWPAAVSSVRDAPRPPLGVGEYLSRSM
jgi:hypothetical protein